MHFAENNRLLSDCVARFENPTLERSADLDLGGVSFAMIARFARDGRIEDLSLIEPCAAACKYGTLPLSNAP